MEFSTQSIHGWKESQNANHGVNVPIDLSTTFSQPDLDHPQDFAYARGGNPTRKALEDLTAVLENANFALACASGMAATTLVLGLLSKGDKILLNSNVYGGTYRFVSNIFKERGLEYELLENLNDLKEEDIDDNVKAIFVETPSNPLLEVTDIERLARLAKDKGILLIVDNTFMTSYVQKPLELGADIVVYSATKYYGGHSDVIAGLVALNDSALYEKLKFLQNTYGNILSPFDSYLILRGMKTLALRMDQHQKSALTIARFLEEHPLAAEVYYPGLESSPGYEIQKKQAKGSGGVLSIRLADGVDMNAFFRSLKLFDLAVSLGGVESLICHPASMTHESYPRELQDEIGITQDLIRISVGVEDEQDLIDDLNQALQKAAGKDNK